MTSRRLLLPAVLLGALLLPASGADAGRGFFLQQNFRLVDESEDIARGGFTSWFRFRNDRSTVQGLRVWATGLSVAEGATVWFAKPGVDRQNAEEIGAMASSENGSAHYEIVVESPPLEAPALPLGLESVLKLYHGILQVRDGSDVVVLEVRVGQFSFEDIDLRRPGRNARLRTPPESTDGASGNVRTLSRGRGGARRQTVSLTAKGLLEDGAYEVWIERRDGDLEKAGDLVATVDGLGLWAVDAFGGDDLLPDFDPNPATVPPTPERDPYTVEQLRRRRVELRRSGFTEYSLVGLFR